MLDARADLLAKRHERKWQPSPAEPALVIAVDELAELDADSMALFERLARMGRAGGIILIALTQRPSADVLGGLDARTQMAVRIALGVVEPRDGELILGAGRVGAAGDQTGWPGWGTSSCWRPVSTSTRGRPAPYWLTDATVSATAGRSGVERAALDAVSAAAADGPQEPPGVTDRPDVESRDSDPDAALLAALGDAPRGGLSADELAEHLGRGRTWVYKRLNAHARAGRAVRPRRGRWAGSPARRGRTRCDVTAGQHPARAVNTRTAQPRANAGKQRAPGPSRAARPGATKRHGRRSARVEPVPTRRAPETHEQAVKRLLDSRLEQGFSLKCDDPVVLATILSLLPDYPPRSR